MAQTYKMMLGTSGKQWEQLTVKDDGTMMLYFHGTDRSVTQQVTAVTEGEWKGWLRSEKGSMWPGIDSGRWQLMEANYEQQTTADVTDVATPEPTTDVTEVAESETTTDNTDCTNNHAEPEVIETTTDCTDNEVCVPATVEPIMADSPQLETSGYSSSAELEQLRAENQRLQEQIAQMADVRCKMADEPLTVNPDCNATLSEREPLTVNQPRQRHQRKPRVERQEPAISHQTSSIDPQPSAIDRPQTSATLKAVGMVAAATVALFVIYETGLLIPLGLIGLATGGILK